MITEFKIFEKLGVDDTTVRIVEKIWPEFLKHYDKSKVFSDKSDKFSVDIREFKTGRATLDIVINYNESKSQLGFGYVQIGAISREATRIKGLSKLKEEILHEVKHLMYALIKYGKIKGKKEKFFINPSGVSKLIGEDIIGSFENPKGNLYKMRVSVQNFLKYNQLTDSYKKLIVYLYLANEDELSARLQEFYNKSKISKNFLELIRKENKKGKVLAGYKDMINFKININDFSENEKKKVFEYLFKPKDIKKVEKYINQKGEQFVRKVDKLWYFNQYPNAELKDSK